MNESMTQFDTLKAFLDIAIEYKIELTPELFNNTVNAVTKENPAAMMESLYAMMADLKMSDCDCRKVDRGVLKGE